MIPIIWHTIKGKTIKIIKISGYWRIAVNLEGWTSEPQGTVENRGSIGYGAFKCGYITLSFCQNPLNFKAQGSNLSVYKLKKHPL